MNPGNAALAVLIMLVFMTPEAYFERAPREIMQIALGLTIIAVVDFTAGKGRPRQ